MKTIFNPPIDKEHFLDDAPDPPTNCLVNRISILEAHDMKCCMLRTVDNSRIEKLENQVAQLTDHIAKLASLFSTLHKSHWEHFYAKFSI